MTFVSYWFHEFVIHLIVLARVKVSLTNTVIQVNYENTDSSKLFLRLRIERYIILYSFLGTYIICIMYMCVTCLFVL